MKLDRNLNADGTGKYALLLMRKLEGIDERLFDCIDDLGNEGLLDTGHTPDTDFFVIRLKDKYAFRALVAYAAAAESDGEAEWANEIRKLAFKALNHPNKHKPD